MSLRTIRRLPEALTYQFIVKARPFHDGSGALDHAGSLLSGRITAVEELVRERDQEIRRLQSRLQWIKDRPTYKALKWLHRLLPRPD